MRKESLFEELFLTEGIDLQSLSVDERKKLADELRKGSAHETEKIVRLGLPRIIRLKENAPELDYSSFLRQNRSETKKDQAGTTLPTQIVGHAGDGNFHVCFLLNPNNSGEMAEAERLNQRMVHRALLLDSSCTGEHGIGYGKIDLLVAEHGEAVSVMHAIKKAIDPDNIMNPGKILRT